MVGPPSRGGPGMPPRLASLLPLGSRHLLGLRRRQQILHTTASSPAQRPLRVVMIANSATSSITFLLTNR